ncbi:MAG: hypothetical protein KF836_12160 [Fimbriimonadaceae bacterium]|nr:hypothetical protein [Fimbriimonadaceae bacterium]
MTAQGGLLVVKDTIGIQRKRRISLFLCAGFIGLFLTTYQWTAPIAFCAGIAAFVFGCGAIPPLGNAFLIEPNAKTIKVNRKVLELKSVALIEVSPLAEATYVVLIHFEDSSWLALCEAAKAEQLTRLANLIRQILTPDQEK